MEQFIASLPKTILAVLAIVGGFALILLFDPPHTVCDSQMEVFREAQKAFLYTAEGGIGFGKKAMVHELYGLCKGDNSPGGCFEYFVKLKKLAVDLRNIPGSCSEAVADESEVQEWLWKSLKLMTQIAWGERAPASHTTKHSWYDASDLALYCDLRDSAIRLYGSETFNEWREAQMMSLPHASQLQRDQIWQKSIFSTSCEPYR